MISHCHAGCKPDEVWDALSRLGILERAKDDSVNLTDWKPPTRTRELDEIDRACRIDYAKRIWASTERVEGTIVEEYLRGRGIIIPIPPMVTYHPNIKIDGVWSEAMVVGACDLVTDELKAVHVARLQRGADCITRDMRRTYGCLSGAAVKLALPAEEIAIAEGVETALSHQQMFGTPTWAMLGTAGIACKNVFSNPIKRITIAADDGDPGWRAAATAKERIEITGLQARIRLPLEGYSDFNDQLRDKRND